jgi:Fuc2NAc and GlcNAc transferase
LLLIASFLLSLLVVYLVKTNLQSFLVDIPNDRSSHTHPTPRGGGIGFIIAFASTSLLYSHQTQTLPTIGTWWLSLMPLSLTGLADDRWPLSAKIRYPIQFLTATTATLLLHPFPQPWLYPLGSLSQPLATLFTIIGFTAIINFYNFMDGIDGLVASTTLLQLAFLSHQIHQPILWLLVTALLGFLCWNWSPAKIFMGDAGSTFLGATVALSLLQPNLPASENWTALAITAPLLLDAIYTLCRRLLKKENIFQAHRSHLYQRLQQTGLAHSTVSLIYLALTGITALLIFSLNQWGAILSVGTAIALIVLAEKYIQKQMDSFTEGKI